MHPRTATLLAASLLLPAAALAQPYSILDLQPASPFDDALAYGLSNNGKVVGTGTVTATGELHAFTYDTSAGFHDLGTFGYPYGADAIAINNAGQIAGTGYGPGFHALRDTNGTILHLGSSSRSSEPFAINALGHIVGRIQGDDGGFQGFSYLGSFTALSVDYARGINDADQIVGSVGYYWTQNNYVIGVEHAFVMTGGGGNLTDLGNLGGGLRTNTEAYAINNAGQITGYSTTASAELHAFIYEGGSMRDLGTIAPYYTRGLSINSRGDVLGDLETYVGAPVGSFLYTSGALHNLQDLLGPAGANWSNLAATHINDSGWIVGYGTINNATHGFLIRPRPALFTAPAIRH